jgi:Tetratricopeptide repeat
MADLAGEQGNYAEAEALLNTEIEGDRRVLGPQNQETVRATSQQAGLLDDEGKSSQAEALDRQVLDIDRRDLGPESRVTIKDMSNLTWV